MSERAMKASPVAREAGRDDSRHGRRRMLAWLGAGGGIALAPLLLRQGSVQASQYPSRPVRIVVAGPAGGGTDFVARLVAEKLSLQWKQPVVVENRPGASGVIGTRVVQQAAPDGYTLILGQSATHAIVPAMQQPAPYDPVHDFVPVVQVSSVPDLLVVAADSPIQSWRQLIEAARARPGSVTYGSAGVGLPQHLIGFRMAELAGVEMRHIPYKGSPPGLTDLMSGQITSMVVNAAAAMSLVKSGRVRPIATNASSRLSSLPSVPTFAELGLPALRESGWNGLFAPAATPPELVGTINAAVRRVLADPDVRARLAQSWVRPVGDTPEQFARFHVAEVRRWAAIVEESGIKVE
ncbi:tripartite tricarboxylate transporter substrate binding protein [Cupriavidus sp. AU9028]|uniref:Bug family tripartite tricarboxylate transporter substrate binding protein n=1 Tax=Cupriavidus sp. AU9028 TaxID=2871157 RepID=UPI001C9586B4|nr:tripartite tricarboxylate transporter substrate binding protein [Cupriavidus sp. AU9028]MBY4897132.1 tripartite tricarboxylate transporter substrate binding protein [Cupriavidus sp. AU9028]